MIIRSLSFVVVLAAAMILSRDGVQKAHAISADFVVDQDIPPCITPNIQGAQFTDIGYAVDSATTQGTTIYVCPGLYDEHEILMDTGNVTLTGPGATPEDDGVAIVRKKGVAPFSSPLFNITSDSVKLRGMYIDATAPAGWDNFHSIVPIQSTGLYSEISDNTVIHYFDSASIIVQGFGSLVLRNKITDNPDGGIQCHCDSGYFSQNEIGPDVGPKGLLAEGPGQTVIENKLIGSSIDVINANLSTMTQNTIDITGLNRYGISASGNYLTIANNTIKNTPAAALILMDQSTSASTSATVTSNTFQDVGLGIQIAASPGGVSATIGGSEPNANTFRNNTVLIDNLSPYNFNAEYNDWGLCSLAEIEAKIAHKVDNAARGLVDFDPFVLGPPCATPTPTPTASPTPSPPPTTSPTATSSTALKRGDVNCDGIVRPDDGLELVVYNATLAVPHSNGCPDIGGMAVLVGGGEPFFWGDVDCDDDVDLDDFLALFAYLAGIPLPSGACDPNADLGDVVPFP